MSIIYCRINLYPAGSWSERPVVTVEAMTSTVTSHLILLSSVCVVCLSVCVCGVRVRAHKCGCGLVK